MDLIRKIKLYLNIPADDTSKDTLIELLIE